MTKEADDIARAFLRGEKCTRARTRTDGQQVILHHSRIAWKGEHDEVYLSFCGWHTTTTTDRLNAICEVFNAPRFRRVRGVQYWGDEPQPSPVVCINAGPLMQQLLKLEAA